MARLKALQIEAGREFLNSKAAEHNLSTPDLCHKFRKEVRSKAKYTKGRAQYCLEGTLKDTIFENVTPQELAFLVDEGGSFFGGDAGINKDTKKFSCTIYID